MTAEGETLVQNYRSVDAAEQRRSAWTPAAGTAAATVRLEPLGPRRPSRQRRVDVLAEPRVGDRHRLGRVRSAGRHRDLRAPHLARRRHDVVGAPDRRDDRRLGRGRDARPVPRDRTPPATRRAGRPPAPPSAASSASIAPTPTVPTVTGGSLTWQSVGSVALDGSGGTDGLSGVAGYEPHDHRRRHQLERAVAPEPAGLITAEGQSASPVPHRRPGGQRIRLGAVGSRRREHRPHRPHAPVLARRLRRGAGLAERAQHRPQRQHGGRPAVRGRVVRVPPVDGRRRVVGVSGAGTTASPWAGARRSSRSAPADATATRLRGTSAGHGQRHRAHRPHGADPPDGHGGRS